MLSEKLKINPDVIELIEKYELDRDQVLLCLFGYRHCEDTGILVYNQLLTQEIDNILRLHFLNRDHRNDRWVLRMPLFTLIEDGEYEQFINKLIDRELGSYGVATNQQTYPVFSDDEELRRAYDSVKMKLGQSFDQDKLVDVIIAYYTHGTSTKKIQNYMNSAITIDYHNGNVSGPVIRGDY